MLHITPMIQSATTAVELPVPNMEVGSDSPGYLDATFAACEQLARTRYENFSIGSHLLPKHLRRHFYSIYAFSRGVDDLGDEADGDRLALLDMWENQLDTCYGSAGVDAGVDSGSATASGPTHPYFVALAETIRIFDIPPTPFKRLIEANRRDQNITHHEKFDDIIEYCTYSADPVGHLVLYLGAVPHAVDQQLAGESSGYPNDHVSNQIARQAVHGTRRPFIVGAAGGDPAVRKLDPDRRRQRSRE